ncbi:MAG: DUF5668 domain-containing protein [Bacteroidota bacterium]|nr:DUF5668 domain-containing protein [Bacteroidota bacterium]
MMSHAKRYFGTRLIIGICIILAGIILLLENLGVESGWLFRYWPLAIVAWGLGTIVNTDRPGVRLLGGVILVIGLLVLARNLEWVSFSIGDLWPLLLIAVGVGILSRGVRPFQRTGTDTSLENTSFIKASAVLGAFHRRFASDDFTGGEITAVLGGGEIDLRAASMRRDEAVLDVFVLLGGVELFIPKDWNVRITGTPILGGYEDKTFPPADKNAPRLIIRGSVILGGVEIMN